MPRFLQLIALGLALLLVGVPTMIAEIAEDDCAEECAGSSGDTSCPEEGCTDCSIRCSGCGRSHVVPPSALARLTPWRSATARIDADAAQRVPVGPPPQGVFHPPRTAG